MIFDLYLEGDGTKDVLSKMNIKETPLNTIIKIYMENWVYLQENNFWK